MKILLINPPFYRFIGLEQDYVPLSLLSVGSQLTRDGHDVMIKNMEIGNFLKYEGYNERLFNFDKYSIGLNTDNIVWQELMSTIESYKPDKIGITVLSVKYKSALKIIQIADSFNVPVMVGGPHVNTHINDFSDKTEKIIGEFESFQLGKRISDLDTLPMPNFDILMDKYSPNGYAHIVSARGCPFECKFCASNTVWNRKVTFKSAKRIYDEMKTIHERFNNNLFTFWDETFTLNKKRILDFCSIYDLKVDWCCDTRADVMTDELAEALSKSNCKYMGLGIESGTQHILNYIGKNETLEDFKKASKILNNFGIKWKAYCIIGFPEETESDILETIRFIKELSPFRIILSFFTPYTHTQLFDDCVEKGIINKDFDATKYAHQSPHNYFCPKITKERYDELKISISKEVDEYNKNAIIIWK